MDTPRFKFGDMVRHKKYGVGVISYVKEGNIDFYVSFSSGDFNAWILQDDLELIHHPDTVRLDWLQKHAAAADWQTLKDAGCLREAIDSLRIKKHQNDF